MCSNPFRTRPKVEKSSTTYDQGILDAGGRAIDRAEGIANTPFADNESTIRGLGILRGAGSGGFNMAAAQPYMDMFRENAMHGVNQLGRTLKNTVSGIRDRSGFGMGGSRNVVAQLGAAEATGRQQADLLSGAGIQGLGFASARHDADLANALNLAGQNLAAGEAERLWPMLANQHAVQTIGAAPKTTYGRSSVKPGGNPGMQLLGLGIKGVSALAGGGAFGAGGAFA